MIALEARGLFHMSDITKREHSAPGQLDAGLSPALPHTGSREHSVDVNGPIPTPTVFRRSDLPGLSSRHGDLYDRDHDTTVQIINGAILTHRAALDQEGHKFSPTKEASVRQLNDDLIRLREKAHTHYPSLVRHIVSDRYREADEVAERDPFYTSAETRVKHRLAATDGVSVISDFDGTITERPDEYLVQLIPGSVAGEKILEEHGRNHFAEAFADSWQHVLSYTPEVFVRGGQNERLRIRPGVNELFGALRDKGVDTTVLSANFKPFVEGGLSRIPEADGYTKVLAIETDDIRSTEKGALVTAFALENPQKAMIYIGDGSSDLPALEAKKYVAAYFAFEGSTFAKELEAAGVPYFTYRDFNDIYDKMSEIGIISSSATERAAAD